MPAVRQASSSTWTPTALEVMNSAAPAIDRSTCDSAAKLITASWPGRISASLAGSQMSPWTNAYPGLSLTGSRLAGLPA